jgi:hypothetical protein
LRRNRCEDGPARHDTGQVYTCRQRFPTNNNHIFVWVGGRHGTALLLLQLDQYAVAALGVQEHHRLAVRTDLGSEAGPSATRTHKKQLASYLGSITLTPFAVICASAFSMLGT